MENFATLHAFTLTNKDWLLDSRLKTYVFSGQSLMAQGWITGSITAFQTLSPELFTDSYVARLVEIIGPLWDKKYAFHVHEELGIPPVLTHGDLHNNNIMWKKNADGSGTTDELAVIVDWQVMHPGCVGEDFARLFCGSVNTDVRRQHTDNLLAHYYKALTARLNKEPPFSLAQLKEAYRRLFKFGTICFLPGFSIYGQRLHAEGKIEQRDAVMLRCKLLVDDMFEIEGQSS